MSELNPCPFCGGEVSIEIYENPMPYTNDTGKTLWRDEPEGYVIECKNHKWSNSKHPLAGDLALYSWDTSEESKSALIEAWNTRAEHTCHPVEKFGDDSPWSKLVCSECGRPLHVDDAVDENGIEYSELQPYCGCGARVKRGESCHAVSWGLNEDAEWEIKLSCGHSVYDEEPDFCLECGARVVES